MKLNKTIIGAILSAVVITSSMPVYALNNSETSSLYAMSFVVGSIYLPSILLEELSRNSKPIYVDKVKYEGEHAHVYGKSGKENVEFKLNKKAAFDAGVKEGTNIDVNKNKMGYTLGANGQAIGIVPDTHANSQINFDRRKVNP